jgi:hypothetical protein
VIRRAAPLAAAILLALPAQATAADRLDRVAGELRGSPLFVDPDVSFMLDAAARRQTLGRVRDAGFPVYVVVVPMDLADESEGDLDLFLYDLHTRLGRPGVYVAADDQGTITLEEFDVPRDVRIPATSELLLPGPDPAPFPERLTDVLDTVRAAPVAAPESPARPEPPGPGDDTDAGQLVRDFFGAFVGTAVAVALLFWLLWFAAVRPLTARRRPAGGTTPDVPTEPSLRWLRRRAREELTGLTEALSGSAGNPGRRRALTAYDAAKLLHDERADEPASLATVIALAHDGRAALDRESAGGGAPCTLNPLHGRAARKGPARLAGLPAGNRPLCGPCAGAPRRTRHSRVLKLPVDGRTVPYHQAPGPWRDIGLGSDDLPQRVLEYLDVE